jgi:ketosteroid isomerase-like protein
MDDESTTPDLVGLARQTYKAVSGGDFEAAMSFFAPDVVCDLSEAGLGTYEGEEAVRGFFEDWHRSWEERHFEEEELLDLGHGVVFSVVRESGRLVGGDGRVEQRMAQLATYANGKIGSLKDYRDIDEARAAAERLAQERG